MSVWNKARELVDSGLSIFPVVPRGKNPIISSWKQYQQAPPDDIELDDWEDSWPDANIALVTGKVSGVIVVDIDSQEAKAWADQNLPPTSIMQETGKGWHYFYEYSEGWRNHTAIYPGVDIRAEGGYVIIAPSMHERGNQYKLHQNGEWDELPSFPADKFAPTSQGDTIDLTGVKAQVSVLDVVQQGERNHAAFRLACRWASKGLAPEEIKELVWLWNVDKCTPPLGRGEVDQAVNSAVQIEIRNNPDYLEKIQNTEENNREIEQSVFLLENMRISHMMTNDPPKMEFLVDGLVPFVNGGSVGIIAAPGNTGKSFLLIDLAVSIATGTNFAGHDTRKKGVLILNAEDPHDEVWRRFSKVILQKFGPDFTEYYDDISTNLLMPRMERIETPLLFPRGQTAIESRILETCRDHGDIGLIVIDPANHYIQQDFNDNALISGFMATLRSISQKTGAIIVLSHHANKNSMRGDGKGKQDSTATLGAVTWINAARWALTLYEPDKKELGNFDETEGSEVGDIVFMKLAKTNYTKKMNEPIAFRRSGHPDTAGALCHISLTKQGNEEGDDLLKVLQLLSDNDGIPKMKFYESMKSAWNMGRKKSNDLLEAAHIANLIHIEEDRTGRNVKKFIFLTDEGRQQNV